MTLAMKDRAGGESELLFTVTFSPPLFSPSMFFSAAPFYYFLFPLIYSCSLSHHFQHLTVPTQSSRESKGENGNMGISFQLFQCCHCHTWVHFLQACLAQPSCRGQGWLEKGQCCSMILWRAVIGTAQELLHLPVDLTSQLNCAAGAL